MNKPALHSALHQLQQQNAAIRLTPKSIAIWCPGKCVPRFVRQVIAENKAEVRQMIMEGKIEVCPSAKLHRQEWGYPGEEWIAGSAVCGICQRLASIDEVRDNKSNFDKIKVSMKVESK